MPRIIFASVVQVSVALSSLIREMDKFQMENSSPLFLSRELEDM